jgi:hypothetical protein
MGVNRLLFVCALASPGVACLRSTSFHCETSADCGAGGTCQSGVGACSVSDASCDSEQRYGDSAGGLAGQCVPVSGTTDAPHPVDGGLADAPVDAPSIGCPIGYGAIDGGQDGHVYRFVMTTRSWNDQRAFCRAANAYLAIPDHADELAAMFELATSTQLWVGISYSMADSTWVNTKGDTQTFLPWANGAPNNGSNNRCVKAVDHSSFTIRDDRCMDLLPAICECEP